MCDLGRREHRVMFARGHQTGVGPRQQTDSASSDFIPLTPAKCLFIPPTLPMIKVSWRFFLHDLCVLIYIYFQDPCQRGPRCVSIPFYPYSLFLLMPIYNVRNKCQSNHKSMSVNVNHICFPFLLSSYVVFIVSLSRRCYWLPRFGPRPLIGSAAAPAALLC